MRSFLLRFVQDARHPERIEVPSENSREFLVLFGLVQRVRRLTKAYLRLERGGFVSEGSLLVRSALEHSVTAQWAYLTPGGVDRLHVSQARAQASLLDEMAQYSSDPEWSVRASRFREQVPEGPWLPRFSTPDGIMKELDSDRFLSTSYRILSQVGHVTHQATLDFIIEVEGKVELRTDPEIRMQGETLYALTGSCMLASWVLARLEADDQEIRALKDFAKRLHVPWRLDVDLPRGQRRFPDEGDDPRHY